MSKYIKKQNYCEPLRDKCSICGYKYCDYWIYFNKDDKGKKKGDKNGR